jgi:hypothetical protein
MLGCQWELLEGGHCGKICEGDSDYCGTHRRLSRKLKDDSDKEKEKRNQLIEKAKLKQKIARPQSKKVSDKRAEDNKKYAILREQFLNGKWCAYHGHGCIPTTVHHSKGRVGELFLDVRYWVPLCLQAHEWVERNPKEAKEKGLSYSRLATNRETI